MPTQTHQETVCWKVAFQTVHDCQYMYEFQYIASAHGTVLYCTVL